MNKIEEKSFLEERDNLEENYQVIYLFYQEIIETKIKKERENKNENLVKKPVVKDYRNRDNSSNAEDDEMIRDRTPILDLLINKIKYFNVEKKKLVERYLKNSVILKESLEILSDLLGLNDFSEIPIVLQKLEDQHASIEIYTARLTDETQVLEKEQARIEEKIKSLKVKKKFFLDK